ncbi:MAG: hypothetical protein E6J90_00900 [Deltaproteobacteria bacterium]|nr:MAG: hypothetical protein E6J90_00900 [Deltaproteobacteria bacterium]
MTPDLRQVLASRARALQDRLNRFSVGSVEAATEARCIFEDADDDVRCRWLALELVGYAEHVDARALHQVLDVPPGDRLAAHVAAYRAQRGFDVTSDHNRAEFRHFFIEPLSDLEAARVRVASVAASTLVLDFGRHPRDARYPRAAEFSRAVFDRVVAGFMAALHLQLGTLAA